MSSMILNSNDIDIIKLKVIKLKIIHLVMGFLDLRLKYFNTGNFCVYFCVKNFVVVIEITQKFITRTTKNYNGIIFLFLSENFRGYRNSMKNKN